MLSEFWYFYPCLKDALRSVLLFFQFLMINNSKTITPKYKSFGQDIVFL